MSNHQPSHEESLDTPPAGLNDYQEARRQGEQRRRQQSLEDESRSAFRVERERRFLTTLADGVDTLVPHFLNAAKAAGNPEMQTFLVRKNGQQRPVGVARGWVIGRLPTPVYNYDDVTNTLVLLETGELVRATRMDSGYGTSTCPHESRWTYKATGEWAPLTGTLTGNLKSLGRRVELRSVVPDILIDGTNEAEKVLTMLRTRLGDISVSNNLPEVTGDLEYRADVSRVPFYRLGPTGRVSSNRKRLQGAFWLIAWMFAALTMWLIAAYFQSDPGLLPQAMGWTAVGMVLLGPVLFFAVGFPKHLKVKATAAIPAHLSKPRGRNTSSNAPFLLAAWLIATDRRRR